MRKKWIPTPIKCVNKTLMKTVLKEKKQKKTIWRGKNRKEYYNKYVLPNDTTYVTNGFCLKFSGYVSIRGAAVCVKFVGTFRFRLKLHKRRTHDVCTYIILCWAIPTVSQEQLLLFLSLFIQQHQYIASLEDQSIFSISKMEIYKQQQSEGGTIVTSHIQDGARNAIPLIVYITHFYCYKSIWRLVQN